MPATRRYTARDLESMPDDGNRYELVHGELLVTPSPVRGHQSIVVQLASRLTWYLEPYGLNGDVMVAPADVAIALDTVVQPDVFAADAAAALASDPSTDIATLYLAVEIVSPSSMRADRVTKRQLYQRLGVPQYWIVDAAQRLVEVWMPDALQPVIEREMLTWRHPALDVSCEIDLVRLFDGGIYRLAE